MSREKAKEQAEVMLAYAGGEDIECRMVGISSNTWDRLGLPSWNWNEFVYRVKPKEPRVLWVKIPDGADEDSGGFYNHSKKQALEMSFSEGKITKFTEVIE